MGTILLIGGCVASSDLEKKWLFTHMHQAAGGGKPKLAILSSSRYDSQSVYDHFYNADPEFGSFDNNYRALGFEPVFMPLAVDNAEAIKNDHSWASALSECDGAYLQGGNQYNHVKSLLNRDGSPSLLLDALQTILDRGGVVAGTSAGMAAMGTTAFGEGLSIAALAANGLNAWTAEQLFTEDVIATYPLGNNLAVPGIGLIPQGILLDTHFDKRGRLGRLIVAMRDTKSTYGVGVNEGTCLSLKNQVGTVIGDHGIFIVDATDATFLDAEHFSVQNLKLHYLTKGDIFDFSNGQANVGFDKTIILVEDRCVNARALFDEDYGATKCIIDFVHSKEKTVVASFALSEGTGFKVVLRKDAFTKAYHETSILHLRMDIY
jgi:cyanophycinase